MSETPMTDTEDNPHGAKKDTKESDDPKNKTELDKPATGEGDIAVDERGPKNIRGPEGTAKDYE